MPVSLRLRLTRAARAALRRLRGATLTLTVRQGALTVRRALRIR